MEAKVPNVNERRRIPMRAIRAVVEQIAEKFQPEKIILFGSYAYGQPRSESDVDLLVVMETPLRNREQAAQIARAIDYHFGLDLLVRSPQQLAERLAKTSPNMRWNSATLANWQLKKRPVLHSRP